MAENTDLWQIERDLTEQGIGIICGCDEAGAAPLAGPVYAAAVILPSGLAIPGLNDSRASTTAKSSRRKSGRRCTRLSPKRLSAGRWHGWRRRRSTPRTF